MTGRVIDPRSASNTKLGVTERADLLVVGSGPVLVAAIIVAEGDGVPVVLAAKSRLHW